MTCIVGLVAKKRVYLGCDSCGSDEISKIQRSDSKIFRVCGNPKALIGFAGSFRTGQVLQYSERLIEPKALCNHKYIVTKFVPRMLDIFDKKGLIKRDESEQISVDPLLLAYKNKLFKIDTDCQVAESLCGYDAIGGGSDFALGSMASTEGLIDDPIQRVYLALKASAKFGVGITEPFHIYDTLTDKETVFES